MAERIAIYVDGANAYFAQKEALGWWIDWPKFLSVMREGKDLVSARWYQAYRTNPEPPPPDPDRLRRTQEDLQTGLRPFHGTLQPQG